MDRQVKKYRQRCCLVASLAAVLAILATNSVSNAAEPISVSEPASEQRVFSVRARLQVSGQIETSSQPADANGQRPLLRSRLG